MNEELLKYIKSLRSQGYSDSVIKNQLVTHGWSVLLVDEAFTGLNQPVAPVKPVNVDIRPVVKDTPVATPATAPLVKDTVKSPQKAQRRSVNWLFLASIMLLVLLVAYGAYWFYVQYNNAKTTVTTTTTGSTTTIPDSELFTYTDTAGGLSFKYYNTWDVSGTGGTVTVVSPETKASDQYTNGFQIGDFLITRVPYAGVTDTASGVSVIDTNIPAYNDQALQLATQADTDGVPTKILISSLSGYVGTSTTTAGSSTNIVLAGPNNLIVMNFIGAKGLDKLTPELRAIKDSLKITK
jgi:hypothetical protein